MQLHELTCQNCGSPLEYVPGMRQITCPACGTSFHIGQNDLLQPLSNGQGVLFQAWIPEGWQYSMARNEAWCSNQEIVTFDLYAWSPQANLYFFPKAYFRDGNSMKYGLNPLTFQNSHKYLADEEYVICRLKDTFPEVQDIQLQRLDASAFERTGQAFLLEAQRHIRQAVCEPLKYQFSFQLNGNRMYGLFGSVLVHKADPAKAEPQPSPAPAANAFSAGQMPPLPQAGQAQQPQPQSAPTQSSRKSSARSSLDFFMKGGIIGAKMRGEEVSFKQAQQILTDPFKDGFRNAAGALSNASPKEGIHLPKGGLFKGLWARAMDVILVTPDTRMNLYDPIFMDFALNVSYGPAYLAAQQAEKAQVEQIMVQGAMQQQQNAFAAQNRLSQSISQRNNIIMSGYENRQAAQSRMMDNYSQALRGVNAYTSSSGQRVEASVRYDHVYQKGSDYLATDSSFSPGADWTELERKR